MTAPLRFRLVTLADLTIDDAASFRGIAIYGRLERLLRRSGHRFRIPDEGRAVSWDRALFLNLTYWSEHEGADVLTDDHIPADVVAHVGWHEVVSRELGRRRAAAAATSSASASPPDAAGLLLAESIASAFDLYLVGRLLPHAPGCDFVTSQVPLMAECAAEAGLPEAGFAALLEEITRDPERAFEDLRALLFDAATALLACAGVEAAQAALEALAGHRFAPLLHHYQLSNWILYARAYARLAPTGDNGDSADGDGAGGAARELDRALRQAPVSLEWLDRHLVETA